MDNSIAESQAIEAVMNESLQELEKRLDELHLAFACGGNAIVTCG